MTITMRLTTKGMMAFEDVELGSEGDTSRLRPYGRQVIVKMDVLARASPGGIEYPDAIRDTHDIGSTTGCIVAMGPEAFRRYEDMSPWTGDKPAVGDRVVIVMYAGHWTGGADGASYRIMDQNSIIAGIDWRNQPEEAA